MIQYGRQQIEASDILAVSEVLKSDYLTQGPLVHQFELEVAKYSHVSNGVAVNSATSALHIACLALGVGQGDLVWTSAITFVASANCARYCGADVDFVDIDPLTGNMSIEALSEKLAYAKKKNRLPKIVIPVHFGGQPCDMRAISDLGKKFGFRIIEDASHAVGARYLGGPVGNCQFSDVTVFSFHPVKIITTAEGGMALTNDSGLAKKMRLLSSHGITREPTEMTGRVDGSWYYQQQMLGFNYRLTELQAALGLSQLKRLDDYVSKRHLIAGQYDIRFRESPISTLKRCPESVSSNHLYVILLDLNRIKRSRQEVYDYMRAAGIGVNVHYIPVYHQPYYEKMGFARGYCPNAEKFYARAISIPIHPGIDDVAQQAVVDALKGALG
ncbi:MAG TPA: UDP-4-amino-4,6-dideoxy-N-acetyl-beta-L-altrosamine transaminase [Burkholderiaceae bacterium]|nr:UDP-4-amino-4,6-dideoxy-N-acetyl-beta-L-altrosamine transaminase [Burkholderiaceae bacterium]